MKTCPTCQNDLVCHDQGECLRPTPETDEQELHEPYLVNELPFCVVRIDFARRLERERNEAREENARLREALKLKVEREDWMRLAFDMLSLFKEDKDFVITQERVECWRAEWSRISGLDYNEHA